MSSSRGSLIKGTVERPRHARDIPLEHDPTKTPVMGLDRAQAGELARFFHANEIEYLGPEGYRTRGAGPGGWAWKIRIDEGWVAEVAAAHALSVDEDRELFFQRIRRLLWQRAAVETAYALRGLNAIIPMLGDLKW